MFFFNYKSGHYTSFVQIDNMVYWRKGDKLPSYKIGIEGSAKLPSDHDNMEILRLVKVKKYDDADK